MRYGMSGHLMIIWCLNINHANNNASQKRFALPLGWPFVLFQTNIPYSYYQMSIQSHNKCQTQTPHWTCYSILNIAISQFTAILGLSLHTKLTTNRSGLTSPKERKTQKARSHSIYWYSCKVIKCATIRIKKHTTDVYWALLDIHPLLNHTPILLDEHPQLDSSSVTHHQCLFRNKERHVAHIKQCGSTVLLLSLETLDILSLHAIAQDAQTHAIITSLCTDHHIIHYPCYNHNYIPTKLSILKK